MIAGRMNQIFDICVDYGRYTVTIAYLDKCFGKCKIDVEMGNHNLERPPITWCSDANSVLHFVFHKVAYHVGKSKTVFSLILVFNAECQHEDKILKNSQTIN